MTSVTVAAVASMGLAVVILCALIGVIVVRLIPPSAGYAADRRAYRDADDPGGGGPYVSWVHPQGPPRDH
ncbi:hypothetical protein ACFVIM_21360 [Streptomyces sp. NPDC057638]|uniref:hypothetical protein n=1 Tax=Streptomyces sp. NPDC057638 TaxID=3346190 RepID=UPI0036ABAEE3